jgi:hypothetical protein
MEGKKSELTRREFLKGTALVAGGALVASALPLTGCSTNASETPQDTVKWASRTPIPVALEFGSIENRDELEKRINEAAKRGFGASARVEEISAVGADYLKEISDAGFEVELSFNDFENTTTYEEGLSLMTDRKKQFEDVIGRPVWGGGRSRFMYDTYTWNVMDALGLKWYMTDAAFEKFPYLASRPYRMPGHNFVRVPVQKPGLWNVDGDVFPAPDQAPKGMAISGGT